MFGNMRTKIGRGEDIKIFNWKEDGQYYCTDYSWGLGFENREANPQYYNGEVRGEEGTRYKIVGSCTIESREGYSTMRILDCIVESLQTGKRYFVQKRFFVKVPTINYEKIRRLEKRIAEMEIDRDELNNKFLRLSSIIDGLKAEIKEELN